MKHMKIRKILSTLGSLAMCLAILCAMMLPVLADDGIPIEDEKPNTDIKVIPSDANALVLMDVGAESPKGVPGDVVTVVVPVAVNKEYLPSERYMLRNINVEPDIPSDTSVKNWPFDIINASYTRHLDDMSYNSTAEIYYDFRISEFATKGVYPVNFKINATVWRYDDVNGTSITEDVTFTLGVYVTVVGDGDLSGSQTSFGALQVASFDEVGEVQVPTAKPGDTVTFTVPVVNKGGRLSNVTIAPVVSSNVEEFPFIAQNSNYGAYFNSWENGEVNYVEFTFKVSTYATNGNKPVTFRATYFENSSATECTFSSYIYITNGYEKPVASTTKPSAMSVMVEGYKIFVDDAEVSGLMAGDDVTLKITLKNNAKFDTSYKNVATISLVNSNALVLSVGSSDTDYVSVIKAGETAEVEYHLTVKNDADVGPTSVSIQLAYENASQVVGTANQVIMIPVSQPMDVVFDTPIVYGTPTTEKPVSVNLNMINMGKSKAMNVSILAMDGIAMAERYYGGDLIPAATLDADFQINCNKTGAYTGKLIVQYEDANGEQYTQELELPLTVAEPQPEQKEEPVTQAAATVPPTDDTSDNTTPPADDTPKTGGISKGLLWGVGGVAAVGIGGGVISAIVRHKHGRREKAYYSRRPGGQG